MANNDRKNVCVKIMGNFSIKQTVSLLQLTVYKDDLNQTIHSKNRKMFIVGILRLTQQLVLILCLRITPYGLGSL